MYQKNTKQRQEISQRRKIVTVQKREKDSWEKKKLSRKKRLDTEGEENQFWIKRWKDKVEEWEGINAVWKVYQRTEGAENDGCDLKKMGINEA